MCISVLTRVFIRRRRQIRNQNSSNNHVIYILSSQSFFSNKFFFVNKVSIILTNPCFPNLDHGTTIALVMQWDGKSSWLVPSGESLDPRSHTVMRRNFLVCRFYHKQLLPGIHNTACQHNAAPCAWK